LTGKVLTSIVALDIWTVPLDNCSLGGIVLLPDFFADYRRFLSRTKRIVLVVYIKISAWWAQISIDRPTINAGSFMMIREK
jgi:hypothetical protein